jgi:hypothetical protein
MEPFRLLLAPLNWIRRHVFLVREKKRSLLAVVDLIAGELEYNAQSGS